MKFHVSVIILITFTFITNGFCHIKPLVSPGTLIQSQTIGECQACRVFINSFKNGLERTARGKFEGGDAAWEEEKLKKSYKRSEIRLIDIQEGLCHEEPKYEVQCHNTAEKAEDFIEEWWLRTPDDTADIFTFICIDSMKLCCHPQHFGKDCTPCLSCNGNGKCRGDGTRKGNGTCSCDPAYIGDNCDSCAIGYYLSSTDKKITCSPCHRSCLDHCRNGSNKDCIACKPGYLLDTEEGCIDINECDDLNKCKSHQFCVNKEGSYACFECDKSCNGCYGDGPDLCRKCAEGFTKKGEYCAPIRENEDNTDQLTTTRYMTYVGLLIAAGILLPKSKHLGSFVGIMVLSYIVGAEYYCMLNGHMGLINLKDFDLSQIF